MLLKAKFEVVWLQALAWHIVFCSWARTLTTSFPGCLSPRRPEREKRGGGGGGEERDPGNEVGTLTVLLYTPVFKWVLVILLLMKG